MSSVAKHTSPRHVQIHDACDVCGAWMPSNESFIALLGNKNSTALQTGFIAPRFLGGNLNKSPRLDLGKWILCWEDDCWQCDQSPEVAIMHQDCLELFWRHFKRADTLNRLWLAIAWRKPFARMDLHLPKRSVGSGSFALAAEQCGLPLIRLLPPELQEIVRNLTEPHPFSRYVKALDFAREVASASLLSPTTVPLDGISSWDRGFTSNPVTEDMSTLSVVRLAVDFSGLKRIERLPETELEQEYSHRVSDTVFIVAKQECLKDISAHFKYGICRLELGGMNQGLQIWDTPIPPDMRKCVIRPQAIANFMRFHTINLAVTTGITFFFRGGNLLLVHAHTKSEPSAGSTIERFPVWFRQSFTWIYVPLPTVDTLDSFGQQIADDEESGASFTTTSPYFLFRLRIAGDVAVGLYEPMREGSVLLSDRAPSALIYNTDKPLPISIISPYCKLKQKQSPRAPFIRPPEGMVARSSWYYSLAGLEHIYRAQVFYDATSMCCRGMLVEYDNGAQRALGQCRLQVDPSRTWIKPSRLYFANLVHKNESNVPNDEEDIEVVNLRFDDDPEHCPRSEKWECFEMVGTVHFWFRGPDAQIHVSGGAQVLPDSHSNAAGTV